MMKPALAARAREPSTWAAIAAIFSGFSALPGAWGLAAQSLSMGAGALGALMAEKGGG